MSTQAGTGPQPVAELLPSSELLAYYKSRVDDFEKERQSLIEAIESNSAQQAEVHRLQWENRKRAEEIRDLQKALSDAHVFLFEERQRLLNLQSENDELRLQEVSDRQRIQHLLALTQPYEQEITYAKNTAPNIVTLLPRTGRPEGGRGQSRGRDGQAGTPTELAPGDGERVMRTVFMPTANADFLLLKVESLQAQLNEQKQLSAERIAALVEDRRIRDQEEAAARADLNRQIEGLTTRLRKAEDTLRQTTKDYILARRQRQEAEGRAVAAEAALAQERAASGAQLAEALQKAADELEAAKQLADARMEEYVNKFRDQVKQREEELTALQSVHTASKAQYEKRSTELEQRVAKLQSEHRALEGRRQLDLEGWTADITALRKALHAVDRKLHQMRLASRLQDDERLDALLAQLQVKAPSQPGSAASSDAASSRSGSTTVTAQAALDLQRVGQGLTGLEQRVRAKTGDINRGAAATKAGRSDTSRVDDRKKRSASAGKRR